jgi:hypothetical protein
LPWRVSRAKLANERQLLRERGLSFDADAAGAIVELNIGGEQVVMIAKGLLTRAEGSMLEVCVTTAKCDASAQQQGL